MPKKKNIEKCSALFCVRKKSHNPNPFLTLSYNPNSSVLQAVSSFFCFRRLDLLMTIWTCMLQMVSGKGVPCGGGWSVCGGGGRGAEGEGGVGSITISSFLQWYVPEKSKEWFCYIYTRRYLFIYYYYFFILGYVLYGMLMHCDFVANWLNHETR